jgi:hypothetical protein
MGSGELLPRRVRRLGREGDYSAEAKKYMDLHINSPIRLYGTVKHRDKCAFLAYFPYFEKKSTLMRFPCCLRLCTPPKKNFWMAGSIFIKLSMYIMAPDPISTTYFVDPSHQVVSVCVSLLPLPGNGSVKIPLSLLGNDSVKTIPRKRIHT